MKQLWISPVTKKFVFQPLDADADAQLHKERVITVRKAAKFASDEMRTSWKLLVDVMSKSFRKRSRLRRKLQRLHKCKGKHRWPTR